MKKLAGFLFLLFVALVLPAQDTIAVLDEMTGTQLYADPNGNIYLVNGSKLSKLDENGKLLRSFDDSFLGDIYSVDVDNPMKIMVFYRESGKIVFLDDRLSPVMEPLDLFNHGYSTVVFASYSTDNLIWLYDATSHELICIDFYCKEKSKNRLNFSDFNPTQLLACQERVLLMNCHGDGIYLFDAFGTFVGRIPLMVWRVVGYSKGKIAYRDDNLIGEYDHIALADSRRPLPASDCADVVWNATKLYYLDRNNRLVIVH